MPIESYGTVGQPKISKFFKKVPNEAVRLSEQNLFHETVELVKSNLNEIDDLFKKFTYNCLMMKLPQQLVTLIKSSKTFNIVEILNIIIKVQDYFYNFINIHKMLFKL